MIQYSYICYDVYIESLIIIMWWECISNWENNDIPSNKVEVSLSSHEIQEIDKQCSNEREIRQNMEATDNQQEVQEQGMSHEEFLLKELDVITVWSALPKKYLPVDFPKWEPWKIIDARWRFPLWQEPKWNIWKVMVDALKTLWIWVLEAGSFLIKAGTLTITFIVWFPNKIWDGTLTGNQEKMTDWEDDTVDTTEGNIEIITIPESQIKKECAFDWFYTNEARETAIATNIEKWLENTFRDYWFNEAFELDWLSTYDKVVKILENTILNWNELIINWIRQAIEAKDILYSIIEIKDVLNYPNWILKNDIVNKRLDIIEDTLENFINKYENNYKDWWDSKGENEEDLRNYVIQIKEDLNLCYNIARTDNWDDLLKNENMTNSFSNKVENIKRNSLDKVLEVRDRLKQHLRNNTSLTEEQIQRIFRT